MPNLQNLSLRDLLTLASLKGQAGKEHLFDDHPQNIQSKSDESWLEEKVEDGVNKSIPLNSDQIQEAIKIIKTGELGDDLKTSLIGGLTMGASVPTAILSNPFSIFTSPLHTITLPITTARNTAKIFVDPSNRTFRLAILAYARMNGINITESNVNDVYNFLNNPSSDSLEELARAGLETIKKEYGFNDISEAFRKFKSLTHQLP